MTKAHDGRVSALAHDGRVSALAHDGRVLALAHDGRVLALAHDGRVLALAHDGCSWYRYMVGCPLRLLPLIHLTLGLHWCLYNQPLRSVCPLCSF